jgi:hypothetical protein
MSADYAVMQLLIADTSNESFMQSKVFDVVDMNCSKYLPNLAARVGFIPRRSGGKRVLGRPLLSASASSISYPMGTFFGGELSNGDGCSGLRDLRR